MDEVITELIIGPESTQSVSILQDYLRDTLVISVVFFRTDKHQKWVSFHTFFTYFLQISYICHLYFPEIMVSIA